MTLDNSTTDGAFTSELSIAVDHAAFAGHFPGFPVLPGAVLLDEALKRIALVQRLELLHWQVAAAKFLEPVRPGDRLTLEFTAIRGTFRFSIRTPNAVVVTGTLCAIGQGEPVHGH
jgi:3-hydroxyacyl-[acyl-carrier-protein] dehydratase